jgi:hypothetical protein
LLRKDRDRADRRIDAFRLRFSAIRPSGYPFFFREIAIMAIPSTPKATAPAVVPLLDPRNKISAPVTQQMIPIMKRSFLIFSYSSRKPNGMRISRGRLGTPLAGLFLFNLLITPAA